MTVQSTSRRALLKGAAILTAMPVAALGGVPVFDVVEEIGTDLSTFAGRVAAVCEWFDLPQPVLVYDPDDLAGGPLLTEELIRWMRVSEVSFNWLIDGEPGATVEAQRLARTQERDFMRSVRHLDETETRLLLDAMRAAARGEVPLEVGLARCQSVIDARRAAHWAA